MSHSPQFSRRSLTLASAAALAMGALSACTSVGVVDPYTPGIGTETQVGETKLRAMVIVETGEGKGLLTGAIAAEEDDTLTSIKGQSTDAALDDNGNLTINQLTLEAPSSKLVKLADKKITVSGEKLKAGLYARLTFAFEKAGDVTLLVPVVAKDHPDYKGVSGS